MKKILSFLSICCLSLLSGGLLCACGGKDSYSISVNSEANSCVELRLTQDDQQLESEDGVFNVSAGANIRVSIDVTEYGIDMSDFVVKIDNMEKQVIQNQNYSPLTSGETLNYGYFLVSNVKKDITIEISGGKLISSTFTFQVDDIEDSEVIEKLQMTSICLEYGEFSDGVETPEPEFVNLYEYLTTNGNPKFVREYSGIEGNYNPYRTFRLKFEGTNPFDLSKNNPFEIVTKEGETKQIGDITFLEGSYVVDLGDIGLSEEYTILLNFKNLQYQQFLIAKPEDNMTYTVSLDKEVIDYSQEGVVTIVKNLDAETADYSNMTVFLNGTELSMIEGSDVENSVQYKIPSNITPISTGGSSLYSVIVRGITYLVEPYSLYANSVEPITTENPFIMPFIWAINDEGENVGIIGVGSNGQHMTLQGQKNAITWEYAYDEIDQSYVSLYDLYDYDIYVNDDTKVLNVKEEIGSATQDVEKELSNGYTFKAFYNETTQTFDSFQLEFYCTQDSIFNFRNFVLYNKEIDISYSFVDARIENVEFSILDSEDASNATWTELDKDVSIKVSVDGTNVVAFRLSTQRDEIGAHEFKIQNDIICEGVLDSESYNANNIRYTILKFKVSTFRYEGSLEFKLVPAGLV